MESEARPAIFEGSGTFTPEKPEMAPAKPRLPARRLFLEIAVVALLVLLAVARSSYGTRLDGVTVDEPWHIVAGVEYVRSGDFRLNPEHPPLTKLWVGAAMPPTFSLRPKGPLGEKSAERNLVEEIFYYDNDFRAAQQRARIAMFAFHFSLLTAVGVLSCRVFGLAWTAVALSYLALEPTLGAHMPVVMTDLPLALTLLLAALCAGRLALFWSWRWAAALGFATGLALAAKHSALPGLAGIFVFAAAAALFVQGLQLAERRALLARAGRLAAAGLLALATLWACYGFRFHAAPDGSDLFNRAMADKIADLQIPAWRTAIGQADAWHLLPRAYLWGLADTVRAGVEGRGQNMHFLWGKTVKGEPPWYTWPSFLASKLPLALLALTLAGGLALLKLRPSRPALLALAAVAAMALAHLLALANSQGSYAGVRHALPVVAALAVLAGAAGALARQRRSRLWSAAVALLLAGAAFSTLGEERLWEYHNELAGGTAEAWRSFRNEGNDLGQRALELQRFDRAVIAPSGAKLYSDYWFAEEEARALGMRFARRVEDLHDTNTAGIFEGFFFYGIDARLPQPDIDWDPAVELAGLTPVARFGAAEVWRGRQISPRSRAQSLRGRLNEYIYQDRGDDWPMVARKLEEVLAVNTFDFSVAIELGNAYLRQGLREKALSAYRQPFAHEDRGLLDEITREDLEERIASLTRGDALETLKPLRNPWME